MNFARHSSPSSQIFRKLRRTKFDSVLQAENDNDSYGFAVINEQLWNVDVHGSDVELRFGNLSNFDFQHFAI